MIRILHFADAHIDMAAHGRHDSESGLPVRVLDFLKALDTIVDTAIDEKVDLVLFAGDAYKDRTPVPTFQREWGRRIMRLSQAGIPTLLLIGNHDLSPAAGRANALQEFDTLQIPHIRLISKPMLLGPGELEDLPLQVLALPWVTRSGLMAALEINNTHSSEIFQEIEARVTGLIQSWLERLDPTLPAVFTAHASVQGAKYGAERNVMLGSDVVLPGSLVRDPRLDYVALGHIHKAQDLNDGAHPPAIYPGSIERVDFGEAEDEKFFVIANVERGHTVVEWRKLAGRRFIDRFVHVKDRDTFQEQIYHALPSPDAMAGAFVRLVLEYPRAWDTLLDEAALRQYAEEAFEFHLIRRPQIEARIRIPSDKTISSLTPLDLLGEYFKTTQASKDELAALQILAAEVVRTNSAEVEETE